MLDIARLQRIRLSSRPTIQRAVAMGWLWPTYNLPGRRVKIRFEDFDRVPDEPVIYAMNHTDRFNYWPFQYRLFRKHDRYTATWVKGKYYESQGVGKFMELTNNLPTVSRGYLIAKDFTRTIGRRPSDEEYTAMRDAIDAASRGQQATDSILPRALHTTPRDMLGRAFDPARESWAEAINELFAVMMRRFVELHDEVFENGLDLLIFPQGTRSIRLSAGRIGIAQIAMKYRKTIVPIGCNGSEVLYPGGNPLARGGEVTYRFGHPIRPADYADVQVDGFTPFHPPDEHTHRPQFQALVDRVMTAIDGLLDPRYRFGDDPSADGVSGTDRFL